MSERSYHGATSHAGFVSSKCELLTQLLLLKLQPYQMSQNRLAQESSTSEPGLKAINKSINIISATTGAKFNKIISGHTYFFY